MKYLIKNKNVALWNRIQVVAMGRTPEEFADMLGELVYYELEGGYYMLVDNAYSDAFGYLCGGLKEGQFIITYTFILDEVVKMPSGLI